jgi:hypothetical protein
MGVLHTPLGVASLVWLINLPFGWWRAGVRRRSAPWFLAIHIPVLLSIGLRLSLGVGFHLATLPLYVAAFALGQWVGGRVLRA